MEKANNKNKDARTKVFNLIILDRSGSMNAIRQAAIDGFNETLSGIKNAQKQYADTQEHYISLVAFCSCNIQNIFDKVPVCEARPLTEKDYVPCCCTPLFDAMGVTLTSLRRHVRHIDDAVVVVTVITDGLENASHEYSGKEIKHLIEDLQGEGWTFTYMGANQDAIDVAMKMSIHNSRNFDYTDKATCACMEKDAKTRLNFFSRLAKFKHSANDEMPKAERAKLYEAMADAAFHEEESRD